MMNKTKDYMDKFERIVIICMNCGIYGSQISYALIAFAFIRRIDCLIRNKAQECEDFYEDNKDKLSDERLDQGLKAIVEGQPFYNVSGYSLYSIYRSQTAINVTFKSYLAGFSHNVKNILAGLDFEGIIAHLSRSSQSLVDVVSILTTMEMSDIDGFGKKDFENLIANLKEKWMDNRGMGEVFTSTSLSELMAACLCQEDMSKGGDVSILDPVCGTGGLLLAAQNKAMTHFNIRRVDLLGQDINATLVAITNAMLLLSGAEEGKAICGNTLLEDSFQSQYFDYVVGSFPYVLSWKGIEKQVQQEEGFGRFSFGLPNKTDAQFLFIQHMISKMNPSGARMVTLTTGNALWGTDGNNIRRKMFELDLVETIIALPQGVHQPYTSIPVYLWVITNKKSWDRQGKVQLIDARSFTNGSKHECTIDASCIKQIMAEYSNNKESMYSHISSNESFSFFKLKLVHHRPNRVEKVQIPATISIDDYLQKEVYPYTKGLVDIDYNSIEKGCSIQFDDFFGKSVDTLSLVDSSNTLLDIAKEVSVLNSEIESIKERTGYDSYQKIDSLYPSVPFHWQATPLNIVTNIQRGQAKPKSSEDEKGLPYIVLGTLRGDEEYTQKYMPAKNSKLLSDKDVAIVIQGASVGEVYAGMEGMLSSWLAMLQPVDKVLPRFFYYLMKGHERLFMTMKKGAGIPQLDLDALRKMKVYLPSIEEQSKIVDLLDKVVGRIDRITTLLGNDKNAYTQYRQTLIEHVVFGVTKV